MSSDSHELLADLEDAARAEQKAREALRLAIDRGIEAVSALTAAGVPTATQAIRIARALGAPATVAARRRIGAALRQRASRANRRHRIPGPGGGQVTAGAVPSTPEETPMPTLVKKTTTTTVEEFIEEPETEKDEQLGDLDQNEDEDDDRDEEADGDESEEEAEKPRRRQR